MNNSKEILKKVDSYLEDVYSVDDNKLQQLQYVIVDEMKKGLAEDRRGSPMDMIITHLRDVPDGSESGEFLALVFGSTRIRVATVEIEKGLKIKSAHCSTFPIPDNVATGPGVELFRYLANCVFTFLSNWNLLSTPMSLSFTVCYPVQKPTIKGGILIGWAKRINCPDVIGKDVGELLDAALKEKGIKNIKIVAILNDSIASVANSAFSVPDCCVGAVIGTGFNVAYLEDIDKIPKWNGDNKPPRQVFINTESANLGCDGALEFLQNKVDKEIDKNSDLKGEHVFEKLTSGNYIHEQIRAHLIILAKKQLFCEGKISKRLQEKNGFHIKFMTDINMDDEGIFEETMRVLINGLGYQTPSTTDCEIIKRVCNACIERSAKLTAEVILTIVTERVQREKLTVAIDGSLYRMQPYYRQVFERMIQNKKSSSQEIRVWMVKDNGVQGAAMVAAVQARFQDK